MPAISVVIPTHNPREDYLRRVLQALKAQTLPKEQWELLLVDNASPQALSELYDLSWHPSGRHIREEELGVALARKRGIKESTANLLVFVDDDAVLEPNYLAEALVVERDCPFLGSWGGNCVPEFEAAVPSWVPASMWRLTVIDVKRDRWSNLTTLETTPVGAGLCCRRPVAALYVSRLESDSIRASHLDRKGTGLAGYGDIDLSHCALDLGLGTGLFSRLSLTHLIRASRLTVDYFVRHAESDVASYAMFRAVRGYPIQPPEPLTLLGRLRWFLHRIKNRVPKEVCEMQKASRRGAEKGYAAAQDYLRSVKAAAAEPPAPR